MGKLWITNNTNGLGKSAQMKKIRVQLEMKSIYALNVFEMIKT